MGFMSDALEGVEFDANDAVSEIVNRHKKGLLSFHVAYDAMVDGCGLDEGVALKMLFPPIGEDDFQLKLEEE